MVQRLPIVCVTHKVQVQGRKLWAPTAPLPAGQELQERVWVEAPVEEECVVHVELSRRCLKGMVSNVETDAQYGSAIGNWFGVNLCV